jgi:hypothetical protein
VAQFGSLFTPQAQTAPSNQGQPGDDIQQLKTQLRSMVSPEVNQLLDRIDTLKAIDAGTGKQQGQIDQCNKVLEGMLSPEAKQLLDKINALEKGEAVPVVPPADTQPVAAPAGAAAAPAKTKPAKKPKRKPKGKSKTKPKGQTPASSSTPVEQPPAGYVFVNTRYGKGIRPKKGGWAAV